MKNKKKPIDLTIRDLTVRQPTIEIHEILPVIPFSLIVIAKSESGKTNIILNIILNIIKIFKDNLYIFQETPDLSVKKHLLNKKINGIKYKSFFDRKGNNILESIFNYQEELYDNDEKMDHTLLYLDDIYHEIMDERYGIIKKIYTAGRHYNLSIVQVSHRYKNLLSPNIRSNCKYFIFFRTSNDEDLDTIASELCGSLNVNKNDFKFIFKFCTHKQYNFILINTLKNKFYHNLTLPIECKKNLEIFKNLKKDDKKLTIEDYLNDYFKK